MGSERLVFGGGPRENSDLLTRMGAIGPGGREKEVLSRMVGHPIGREASRKTGGWGRFFLRPTQHLEIEGTGGPKGRLSGESSGAPLRQERTAGRIVTTRGRKSRRGTLGSCMDQGKKVERKGSAMTLRMGTGRMSREVYNQKNGLFRGGGILVTEDA